MNEAAVTKFLAETVMGWVTMDDWTENPFVANDSATIFVDEPNDVAHLDFDPIHRIEHAWIVVEKLADVGIVIDLSFGAHEYAVHFWNLTEMQLEGRATATSVSNAISAAAVRALASEDQIEEWL